MVILCPMISMHSSGYLNIYCFCLQRYFSDRHSHCRKIWGYLLAVDAGSYQGLPDAGAYCRIKHHSIITPVTQQNVVTFTMHDEMEGSYQSSGLV